MEEIDYTKETIINVTTELIEMSGGDVHQITSRRIAKRAGVGLGLINYHFGSKENLITICVQRIINQVVMCFSPDQRDYSEKGSLADRERLADWAKQVFDFLFGNRAISYISILGDMQNYKEKSNSMYTQKGFSLAIRSDIEEGTKRMLVFMLTSAMQTAFLAGEASKEILGYDLMVKKQRDTYIDKLVEILFIGVHAEPEKHANITITNQEGF